MKTRGPAAWIALILFIVLPGCVPMAGPGRMHEDQMGMYGTGGGRMEIMREMMGMMEMMRDMMERMKETAPDPSEKRKIDEMLTRMGEMMKRRQALMKEEEIGFQEKTGWPRAQSPERSGA